MASKNNKQKEKLVEDLDMQLNKIENALQSLKDSVNTFQKGDGKQPYWNGANAYNFTKNSLAYIDNSSALLKYLTDCRKSIK